MISLDYLKVLWEMALSPSQGIKDSQEAQLPALFAQTAQPKGSVDLETSLDAFPKETVDDPFLPEESEEIPMEEIVRSRLPEEKNEVILEHPKRRVADVAPQKESLALRPYDLIPQHLPCGQKETCLIPFIYYYL